MSGNVKAIEAVGEEVIKPAVLTSRYNDLPFCPHLNSKGRDFASPMLMKTEGGDMFNVTRGGGKVTGKSFAVPDAPFLESKIQGRKTTKSNKSKGG